MITRRIAKRDKKGKIITSTPAIPPKEYMDTAAERKRGYLDQRGENDGRKVRVFSKSPKGMAVRDERARRLARRFIAAFPWLEKPDFHLLRSFCQISILADEAYEKIRQDGLVRKDGSPHQFLAEFRNLVRTGADLAGRLGLSPRDRALMKSLNTTGALDRIDIKRVNEILEARNRTKVPAALNDNNEEVVNGDDSGSDSAGAE